MSDFGPFYFWRVFQVQGADGAAAAGRSATRVHAEHRRSERSLRAAWAEPALLPHPVLQTLLQIRLLPAPLVHTKTLLWLHKYTQTWLFQVWGSGSGFNTSRVERDGTVKSARVSYLFISQKTTKSLSYWLEKQPNLMSSSGFENKYRKNLSAEYFFSPFITYNKCVVYIFLFFYIKR